MNRAIGLFDDEGNQRSINRIKSIRMKVILITKAVLASQLRSLITKSTPAKNAKDSVARVTPKQYLVTTRTRLVIVKSPI